MKAFLFLFFVGALAQVALSEETDDDYLTEEDLNGEDLDELERSWWSTILSQSLELLKKSIRLDPLNCNGPSCTSCIRAQVPKIVNKQGCFTITYRNSNLNLNVNLDGKHVWGTNVNAGKNVPSCVNLPSPIKEVCIRDFNLNASQNGQGNLCFTVGFKNYGFGARYCANVSGGHLHAGNLPTLVKI